MESILELITKECDAISKEFNQKKTNTEEFFCLVMLKRLNSSCHSLRILMQGLNENGKSEYSCGIIIRSVLLDTMISINVMIKFLDESEARDENLTNYCSIWLADSLKHSIENVSKLYQNKTREDRMKIISNLINCHPDFFEEDTINNEQPKLKKKFRKPENAAALYLNIKNSDLERLSSIYEGYLFYSKYDHFGQVSYEILRNDMIMRIDFLNRSIDSFLYHLFYLIIILKSFNLENKILDTSFKKIEKLMKEE